MDVLAVEAENMPATGQYQTQLLSQQGALAGGRFCCICSCAPIPLLNLHACREPAGRTGLLKFLIAQSFNGFAAANYVFESAHAAAVAYVLHKCIADAIDGRADTLFCRQYRRPAQQPYPWNSLAPILHNIASHIAANNEGKDAGLLGACRKVGKS